MTYIRQEFTIPRQYHNLSSVYIQLNLQQAEISFNVKKNLYRHCIIVRNSIISPPESVQFFLFTVESFSHIFYSNTEIICEDNQTGLRGILNKFTQSPFQYFWDIVGILYVAIFFPLLYQQTHFSSRICGSAPDNSMHQGNIHLYI